MTERALAGHSLPNVVERSSMRAGRTAPDGEASRAGAGADLDFVAVYDEHAAFVHRGVRRQGVDEGAVDDVVQEVFLVVHKRLHEFRQASSMRTWIYGILLRVVRNHRRTAVRANLHGVIDATAPSETTRVADCVTRRPDAAAEKADAWRVLMRVLEGLGEDKREIFVLAELEQIPVPEIAEILGIKLNTAYSRLRLARAAFETAVANMNTGESA
jgi:RNA polymerase sigma-70 factor (ECF subfamily)